MNLVFAIVFIVFLLVFLWLWLSKASARGQATSAREVEGEQESGMATRPSAAEYRPPGSPSSDDLTRIKGIGGVIESKLNALGITSYLQIANFTEADITRVNRVLDFKGRIQRERWVEQAHELVQEMKAKKN